MFSISTPVWPAALPVAFKSAWIFNCCDSKFAPALISFTKAAPTATNPAVRASPAILTLPIIAPIEVILPATGPSGPCTAAIEPDRFLIDSCNFLLPLLDTEVCFWNFFKDCEPLSKFDLNFCAFATSSTLIVAKFDAIILIWELFH